MNKYFIKQIRMHTGKHTQKSVTILHIEIFKYFFLITAVPFKKVYEYILGEKAHSHAVYL